MKAEPYQNNHLEADSGPGTRAEAAALSRPGERTSNTEGGPRPRTENFTRGTRNGNQLYRSHPGPLIACGPHREVRHDREPRPRGARAPARARRRRRAPRDRPRRPDLVGLLRRPGAARRRRPRPSTTPREYSGIYVTLNPVTPPCSPAGRTASSAGSGGRTRPRPTATSSAAAGSRSTSTPSGRAASRAPRRASTARPARRRGRSATRLAARGLARARRRGQRERRPPPLPGRPPERRGDDRAREGRPRRARRPVLDGAAKVDTANFNAARIWKVYGTVSRKGDSTKDRPHRRSAIVARPFEPEVVPADSSGRSPRPCRRPSRPLRRPRRPPAAGRFDLGAWLREHGVAIAAEKPWQGGTLYTLAQCPFSDAHADGAYAVQFANGAIHVGCKHDSLRRRAGSGGASSGTGSSPAAGSGRAASPPARARRPAPTPAAPPAGPRRRREGEGGPRARRPRPVLPRLLRAGPRRRRPTLARCLVMSIASPDGPELARASTSTSRARSGKGKSSGMTAMLRQVPEEYRLAERMSNKALYYSDDISPGTVLLLDDIALSEELQEVLKESTTQVHRAGPDAGRRTRTGRSSTAPSPSGASGGSRTSRPSTTSRSSTGC